jgi:DNA-binding CsgD family transcriptional regulator
MAQAMLAGRDPIRSEKGKVVLAMPASQGALERAVAQAGADEAGLGTKGIGIPARRAEGEPCVVHVLPLERSDIRPRFGPRAAAALFVAPATALPSLPSGAVALLYDLTPAETRIFELISGGKTQIEIGQTLGIAPSTVKTHTLRLFEKTGSKRQADLIRLAARLASPA